MIMDTFDDRQNRLLWRAALGVFVVMRDRDDMDRVARIAAAWDYLTGDTRAVFPLATMEPVPASVTARLVQIAYRARVGHALCPELGVCDRG